VHFSTDGVLGWIRLCYTAAQLRLQRHDQAALCERFHCYGHIHHRFMHNNAMRFVNLKTRCRRRDGAWPCRSKPLDKLERNTKFLRLCQWQRTLRAEAICLTLVAVGRGIATGLDGRSSQKLLHGQRFYCHVTEHKLDHKGHVRLCFVAAALPAD
jgi:hypothetical protein